MPVNLEAEDYKTVDWESAPDHVNYGALYQKRYPILRKAVRRFQETASDDYEAFAGKMIIGFMTMLPLWH